jgi:hypothetical protein
VLIFIGKILFDIIPGMSQETSWTLVNLSYTAGSYLMFHYVRGVPFDFNSGAYDNLNMWEQIDNGDQYTPAKKFLLFVPIALFLISTHYTHYDSTYFIVNCMATIAVVIPKLPSVRVTAPTVNMSPLTPHSYTDYEFPFSTLPQTTYKPHPKQKFQSAIRAAWICFSDYVFLITSSTLFKRKGCMLRERSFPGWGVITLL